MVVTAINPDVVLRHPLPVPRCGWRSMRLAIALRKSHER
jgi:hypothetical protein